MTQSKGCLAERCALVHLSHPLLTVQNDELRSLLSRDARGDDRVEK